MLNDAAALSSKFPRSTHWTFNPKCIQSYRSQWQNIANNSFVLFQFNWKVMQWKQRHFCGKSDLCNSPDFVCRNKFLRKKKAKEKVLPTLSPYGRWHWWYSFHCRALFYITAWSWLCHFGFMGHLLRVVGGEGWCFSRQIFMTGVLAK